MSLILVVHMVLGPTCSVVGHLPNIYEVPGSIPCTTKQNMTIARAKVISPSNLVPGAVHARSALDYGKVSLSEGFGGLRINLEAHGSSV